MFIPVDVEATEIVCTLHAPAHRDLIDIIDANVRTALFLAWRSVSKLYCY